MGDTTQTDDGNVWTQRTVDVRLASTGLIIEVQLHRLTKNRHGITTPVGRQKVGPWAFVHVNSGTAVDVVRGDVPDADGPVLAYVGDHFDRHYYTSKPRDGMPVDVYEALVERDVLLLEDVDGGWSNWDGRPEWSETYIDLRDAEPVDMTGIIEQRRDDGEGGR